eukprot:tig00020554_g10809.t1
MLKAKDVARSWKIFVGDTVRIRTGVDAGKVGRVQRLVRDDNKVVVEGVNLIYRDAMTADGKPMAVPVPQPVHYSNVELWDLVKQRRIKSALVKDEKTGRLKRINKISGEEVPMDIPRGEKLEKGPKDTEPAKVAEITYDPTAEAVFHPAVPRVLPPALRVFQPRTK